MSDMNNMDKQDVSEIGDLRSGARNLLDTLTTKDSIKFDDLGGDAVITIFDLFISTYHQNLNTGFVDDDQWRLETELETEDAENIILIGTYSGGHDSGGVMLDSAFIEYFHRFITNEELSNDILSFISESVESILDYGGWAFEMEAMGRIYWDTYSRKFLTVGVEVREEAIFHGNDTIEILSLGFSGDVIL